MSETPKSKSEDIGFELEYETTPFNDFPNNGISPQTHSIMIKKVSTRELDFSNPNINIIKNEDSNNPNSIISSIVNKEDSDIYLKNRFEDFEGK